MIQADLSRSSVQQTRKGTAWGVEGDGGATDTGWRTNKGSPGAADSFERILVCARAVIRGDAVDEGRVVRVEPLIRQLSQGSGHGQHPGSRSVTSRASGR
jgi:hypothetical protein